MTTKYYQNCVRNERRARFAYDRENRAYAYVYAPFQEWREWMDDHNVSYAGVNEQECSSTSKDPHEFHPLLSIKKEVRGDRYVTLCSFSNPRPGIDVDEWMEFEPSYSSILTEGVSSVTLHTVVTVWHKGIKKVHSQAGYSESHRTRELSWIEAAELLRKWTAEAEQQAEAERQAEEYQREQKEYTERWEGMEGMRLEQGGDSHIISCQYGGPHIADYCGNYLFPIPKNIKSYAELRSKIDDMLRDYYANCE